MSVDYVPITKAVCQGQIRIPACCLVCRRPHRHLQLAVNRAGGTECRERARGEGVRVSGSRDGRRWWHEGEAHPSCAVQGSPCSTQFEGKTFAEGFHPALVQSLCSLQVPFKPEECFKTHKGEHWRRKIPFALLQSVGLVVYFEQPG